MDDWSKFDVDVQELKIEDFKNNLTGDDIEKKTLSFFNMSVKNLI